MSSSSKEKTSPLKIIAPPKNLQISFDDENSTDSVPISTQTNVKAKSKKGLPKSKSTTSTKENADESKNSSDVGAFSFKGFSLGTENVVTAPKGA